jgi:hypothetical protein
LDGENFAFGATVLPALPIFSLTKSQAIDKLLVILRRFPVPFSSVGGFMRRISSSILFALLVLAVSAVLPQASRADTITVNGHEAVSFNLNDVKPFFTPTFSVTFTDLNLGTLNLVQLAATGKTVPTITVDIISGAVTDIYTFTDNIVINVTFGGLLKGPITESALITFASFTRTTSTSGGPGGGGASTPEPSTLVLFGSALAGVVFLASKRSLA